MSRTYPKYPLVGVGAVVLYDNNNILLIKRGGEPNKGKWSIPGGMVEAGESPEDAVLRELYEEAGIKGKVMGLFGVYQYVEYDNEGKVKYHFLILDFLVQPLSGIPTASSDAVDIGIFNINDALKLDLAETARQLIMDIVKNGLKPCNGGLLKCT